MARTTPPRVLTHAAARVAWSVVSYVIFFVLLWTLGAGMVFSLGHDPVLLSQGRWLVAIAYSMLPLFAAHSAGVSFPDGYVQGKFTLTPEQLAAAGSGELPPPNPWRTALSALLLVGLPIGALAFWLLPVIWTGPLSAPAFVTRFAAIGGLIAAVTLYCLTGRRFVREAALPSAARRFPGTAEAYLWQRHVWPQALINLWINLWVSFALVRGPLADPGSGLARDAIVGDAFVSGLVLALAVALGSKAQARFDLRWGVAPPLSGPRPGKLAWVALLLGAPLLAAVLVWIPLTVLHLDWVTTWPLVVGRSGACGAYAGLLAYLGARNALRGAS